MQTELADNETTRFDRFDSWGDFIRFSGSPCEMDSEARTSQKEDREDWQGTRTYQEAVDLAAKGWAKGARKASDLGHDIEEKLYNLIERPTISYDVTGEILDIGRFCSGMPEHWGVFETQLVEGPGTKYIYIVVNNVCSGGIDASTIMERGAATVALIHLLELAGHRCKVDMVMADGNSRRHYELRVPIKHYNESLDMDMLAYALAHPSTFRRHCFSVLEHLPLDYREALGIKTCGGYGTCQETKQERGDIYLPMMEYGDRRWRDGETATQWVKEELVRLGVVKPEY